VVKFLRVSVEILFNEDNYIGIDGVDRGDVGHFATVEPTMPFCQIHSPHNTALQSSEHRKQHRSDANYRFRTAKSS